ncbi:MAG: TolC family protein [Prevotellaceae bacterium]|jgi:outer membrane protein TolC|nr:TolC family protein [Prevotellaceae bacterium]
MKKPNCFSSRRALLIGLLATATAGVYAQDTVSEQATTPVTLTLDKALEIALTENPTIIVAGQEIEKKQYAKKEVIANLLPQISASAGYTRTLKKQVMYMGGGDSGSSFTDMIMAPLTQLVQPLYEHAGIPMPDLTGGNTQTSSEPSGMEVGLDNNWNAGFSLALPVFAPTLYKTIQMSTTDIELAVEQARSSKQNLVNQVSKAYYQLLLAQDSYEVIQQSYKQAEDNYRIVNNRFEQGLVSEYDKIRAEVQLRNLNPSLLQARNAVTLAKLQLKVLMGMDAGREIVIAGKLSDYEGSLYGDFIKSDTTQLANNSTLRQLDLQTKMLEQTYAMNKRAFLPTVSLSAIFQYTAMNNDFKISKYRWNPYSTVGVTVSIPLFTGGSRVQTMKQTKLQLSQLNLNAINTRRQLNMQLQSYMNNMQQSIEQLASNKENVNQAMKGRTIAQKRYDIGNGTILELNDSELALTQARLTYTQAIYDYLVAKTDMDQVLGIDLLSKTNDNENK